MNLDFFSVDIGSILFNLINTLILFLVIKHFLFKPVNKILEERKNDIQETYSKADIALDNAKKSETQYNELIGGARDESAEIIKNATQIAQKKSDEIITGAKKDAGRIIERANFDINREKLNARNAIKEEISELAILMAEKVVDKEINTNDHRKFIDDFIENVGE